MKHFYKILSIIIVVLFIVIVVWSFRSPCDAHHGWNTGVQKNCVCLGKKFYTNRSLAVDGNDINYCVGIQLHSECYALTDQFDPKSRVIVPCR